jgi:hypothetical protein
MRSARTASCHRERAAAHRAEAALDVGRGAIPARLRAGPREGAGREVNEGHEGGAREPAAHGAVAVHDPDGIGARPIAHRPAKTSAGPFHGILLGLLGLAQGAKPVRCVSPAAATRKPEIDVGAARFSDGKLDECPRATCAQSDRCDRLAVPPNIGVSQRQ